MSSSTSASLVNAIEFLTRPLLRVYPSSKIVAVQVHLRTALAALYSRKQSRLTISICPGDVAPRALYPSCLAAGVRWGEWFAALGSKEFDLIIEDGSVSVRAGSAKTVVWAQSTSSPNPTRQSLQATLNSALARARGRTPAQLLLESPEEDKEADELFARISKASVAIVSPTPTRDTFPPSVSAFNNNKARLSAIPEDVSRPSSRSSESSMSSVSSSSSASSVISDVSSATSASSSSICLVKPYLSLPTPASILNGTTPLIHLTKQHVAVAIDEPDHGDVHIDTSKKNVTKYLYQGGSSSVLTGGVMLGAVKATPAPKRSTTTSWRKF